MDIWDGDQKKLIDNMHKSIGTAKVIYAEARYVELCERHIKDSEKKTKLNTQKGLNAARHTPEINTWIQSHVAQLLK